MDNSMPSKKEMIEWALVGLLFIAAIYVAMKVVVIV